MSFGEPMRKIGQRAIIYTEVFLHDVDLPATGCSARRARASTASCTRSTSRGSTSPPAPSASPARRSTTASNTRHAEAFGKPIGRHQAVGFRLADMATRIDAARLLTHRAARIDGRRAARSGRGGDGQAVRLRDGELVTWAAVQTLGGWGYSREYPVEKWTRDASSRRSRRARPTSSGLIISRRLLDNRG